MKIQTIELKNFKFHKDLKFNIDRNNCLVYGENGAGKSSIYWGIYSIFKKNLINIEEYKRYESTDSPNIKIILNDDTNLETSNDSTVIDNNIKSIYFAHQDFLEEITFEENFYQVLEDSLKYFFPKIKRYLDEFNIINSIVDESNYVHVTERRNINIEEVDTLLNDLKTKANNILNHLDAGFSLSFDTDWGISDIMSNYKFSTHIIHLKIDNKNNLKLNFNEAKLKLASIAIFFALIKLEEDTDNEFKLLVLDDFLTSLDMANRKLIVWYILDNFGEYQKIILTHNIQFYNLIIRLLKLRKKDDDKEELTDWDIKNIFLKEVEDIESSFMTDRNEDYLAKAEDELNNYNLEISGNFLRKEFEKIITEFEQLLELGRVEELDKILKALSNVDYIFAETPSKILYNSFPAQMKYIKNILEPSGQSDDSKLNQVRKAINNFEVSIELKKNIYNTSYLKSVLLKTEFYKDILMNYASHDEQEKELHKKEFEKAIKLLKDLKKILKDLK